MSDAHCRQCDASVLPFAEVCGACGAAFPTDELLGRTIRHNIEIESVLGMGGMGTVYKGIETHLQRPVAVKVLHSMGAVTDRHVAYFMREAQVLSRLRHPNLVSVLDFGQEEDGTLFLVLEYIPGQTLDDMLDADFPVDHQRILRIIIQILSALEEAHRHNIVHRDLKPGNVQLEEVAGQKDFVKVLDFGIAKILADNDSGSFFRNGSRTEMGMAVGTPQYMSPEQAQGQPLDGRSDIYSAGLILYEMLTGQIPHIHENLLTMMVQRIGEPARRPSEAAPELHIPALLDDLCLKALALDPNDRYQSVEEFRRSAQAALSKLMTGVALHTTGVMQLPKADTALPPGLARVADPRSSPTLSQLPAQSLAAALAIKPLVLRDAADGPNTAADRLMVIWDFLGQFIKQAGGKLQPPTGGLALALFHSEDGAAIMRAASTALNLRDAAARRFAYARLQMGLAQSPDGAQEQQAARQAAAIAHRAMGGQILAEKSLAKRLGKVFNTEEWEDCIELAGIQAQNPPPSAEKGEKPGKPGPSKPPVEIQEGFIGRPGLRKRLLGLARDVSRGEPGEAVLLTGPDGVGKSHAIDYLRRLAHKAGLPVFEAYADPNLIDRPFRPLFDLAVQIAGQHTAPAHRIDHEQLRQGLEMLGLTPAEIGLLVDQFISGTSADPWVMFAGGLDGGLPYAKIRRALHVYPPSERRLALTGAMRSLLRQATATGGAMVILEDLHHADAGTLGCLPGLCDLARRHSLLLVATSSAEALHGAERFEQLPVGKLDPEQTRAFWAGLQQLRPQAEPADPRLERALLQTSQGTPLYLSRWIQQPLQAPEPTLDDLVRAQFAQLPGRLRRLLMITSTMGCYFEVAALETLFPKATSLAPALDGAAQSAWVEPCPNIEGLWRFHSPALQRTIYDALPTQERLNYHRHMYERLKLNGDRRLVLLLALQSWRGGLREEASPLAEQLGDRMTIAGDPGTGHEWYHIALETAAQPQQRLDLHLKAAITLAMAGQPGRAAHNLQQVDFTREPLLHTRAEALRARFLLDGGDIQGAARASADALRGLPRGNPLLASLHINAAEALARMRRPEDAARQARAAIDLLDTHRGDLPDDLLHLPWQARIVQGSVAMRGGQIELAESSLKDALIRARADEDESGILQSAQTLTSVLLRRKKDAEALALCHGLTRDPHLKLHPGQRVTLLRLLGRCHQALGQEAEARRALGEARTLALELGWHAILPSIDKHLPGRG